MDIETFVKEKLKEYNENCIKFLKSQWNEWIKKGRYDLIKIKTGANVQEVYNIFNLLKIKNIRIAKYYPDRYEIKLSHTPNYEIIVIIKFDEPNKGDLGIVTFYKQQIARN